MKSVNFSKNDLLFYYQKYEFPKNLILKDILIHKELLFSDESLEPEMNIQSKKKTKLANSFFLEDDFEPKKAAFKKGKAANQRPEHNITRGNAFFNQPNNAWRKNEFEDPGFFDNFKGKSDERQVNTFKRNLELFSTKENSFSIDNSVFTDHMGKVNRENLFAGNTYNRINSPKQISTSADDLFNNSDSFFSGQNESFNNNNNYFKKPDAGNVANRQINLRKTSSNSSNYQKDENTLSPIKPKFTQLSKEEKSISFTNPDPKKIDFRNIHKINKYFNYGKDEPLWYIFHPIAKSSFGPCSSENLEEMYNGGMVDGQSEVRFIDIYNIKDKKPFSFFKLKDLEDVKFIDEIEISSLLKNAVLINSLEESTNTNANNGINSSNNANLNNNNNKNIISGNNINKNHRKTSSSNNGQNVQEKNDKIENPKESKNVSNAKTTNNSNNGSEKTAKRNLNSILEKAYGLSRKDSTNENKTNQGNIKANSIDENTKNQEKTQKIESTPPQQQINSIIEKEIVENKNIPSIEDVTNKEKDNKNEKEKNANKYKKSNKPKPVGIDVKLKFEDSLSNPTTPSNANSNTLSNNTTKPKTQKDEKTKNKQKVIRQEEHLANSIYSPKTLENTTSKIPTKASNPNANEVKSVYTEIETVQVKQEDSNYNNYGKDQGYYNNDSNYDYYGNTSKNNNANVNSRKNKKRKQSGNVNNANSNANNNDYDYQYQYEYENDEGYGIDDKNYQASNKNNYNNKNSNNNNYAYNSKQGNRNIINNYQY